MSGDAAMETAGRRLASAGDLELVVPECAKGIGAVIGRPDSPDLIAGVRIQPLAVEPQSYKASEYAVEGDWSQAAFPLLMAQTLPVAIPAAIVLTKCRMVFWQPTGRPVLPLLMVKSFGERGQK